MTASPTHILLTHHHDDHIAAVVQDLKNKFQSIIIGYEHDNQNPATRSCSQRRRDI
jgi:glyoxylase-like metal-dependent hydrolase (beta-lactamase superfamily II)